MRNKALATSLVLAVAAGCAPSVGTIDRTQPNAIHKSQFQGLWYIKQTVVDTQPGADGAWDSAVEGYSSELDKIRWEITGPYLVGYRSYEFMPYAEGLTDAGRDFFGSPVVAYPITHFDVQRGYNTTTGIANNTIVENTTDRPWYEREYVRVDWSANVVGQLNVMFRTGWPGFDGGYSAVSHGKYYIEGREETEVNRPFITEDYFDVTNKYLVEPDPYYCYFTLLFTGVPRCGAQNVNVRLAFLKVDPSNDYESLYYPDDIELKDDEGKAIVVDGNGRTCGPTPGGSDATVRDPADCRVATFPYHGAFGNFRINRIAFDKERYLTRTGRIYLAGRHNLWKNSFNDSTGRSIDFADREPKPVIYYGNVDFPEDILPGGQKIGDMWNEPFMETVAALQGMMTADGRGDINALKAKYSKDGKEFRMFEFRQNDCNVENIRNYARNNGLEAVVERVVGDLASVARGNVERVCAAVQFAELQAGKTLDPKKVGEGVELAFTWQREGDPRYSFQNYVHVDQPGPWGVAQFSTDPETGEYISVGANYFGNAGDLISQREVDRLQWVNGDIEDPMVLLRGDITRNTVVSRRGAVNKSIRSDVKAGLMESDGKIAESMGHAGAGAGSSANTGDARFARMFGGTDLEREFLVNDEMLRGFAGPTLYQPANGIQSNLNAGASGVAGEVTPGVVSDAALAAASPVNWGQDIDANQFMNDVRKLGGNAVEFAAFFDPQVSGMAGFFKGKSREYINQWLRVELYAAVQAHEVGHTVGLRHNFGASMDPMNYIREFWEGGYWNNPITPEQVEAGEINRGAEMKYASIMDYGFGVAQEGTYGIGEYDKAAIRFLYGELVDVWNPAKVAIPDPRKYGSFARRCGHDSSFWGFPFLIQYLDYKSIPSILATQPGDTRLDALYQEMASRVEAAATQAGSATACYLQINDVRRVMEEVANFDSEPGIPNIYGARMIVHAKNLIQQETAAILNRPEYDDPSTFDVNEAEDGMDNDNDGVADDIGGVADYFNRGGGSEPKWDNYAHRVDYTFCPDEFAGYSPGCQVWDYGANFTESVDAHINGYDNDYIFNNFRRDRWSPFGWGENPRAYMARLESRRFFHMTNVFRYYLYTRDSALADTPLYLDWAEAAYRGLNFLERVIQTPEPGPHCLVGKVGNNPGVYVPEHTVAGGCADSPDRFEVGLGYGQGKFLDTSWTNEYAYKVNRMGVFYDKLAAIRQITSSSGRFVRDLADLFDRGAFSLGYIRTYEDPIIQRFSALIRGDHEGYRSAVLTDDNGNKSVRYMPFFDEEDATGGSMFAALRSQPKIEPAWSWTLQYQSLAYAISNWSSINDYSPEFYRFTKVALQGTPEDIDYITPVSGRPITIVTFTDPETRFVYRAPDLPARGMPFLSTLIRPYQRTNSWGIGADLLKDLNELVANDYEPKKLACEAARGTGAEESVCSQFEGARRRLNERVGYVDIMRRFNRRAEMP